MTERRYCAFRASFSARARRWGRSLVLMSEEEEATCGLGQGGTRSSVLTTSRNVGVVFDIGCGHGSRRRQSWRKGSCMVQVHSADAWCRRMV